MQFKINDYVRPEHLIENFFYTHGFFTKKIREKTIYFDSPKMSEISHFIDQYFNEKNKIVDIIQVIDTDPEYQVFKNKHLEYKKIKKQLIDDLFRIFHENKKNSWLKKKHLDQKTCSYLLMLVAIVSHEIVGGDTEKKKKNLKMKINISPFQSFLETYREASEKL